MNKKTTIHEVCIHYKRPLKEKARKISTSQEAVQYFREYCDPNRLDLKEFFWVLLTSRNNDALGIAEISTGGTESIHVNLKEIFQLAITANATGIILCHNHPSGNLVPSAADIKLTNCIIKFGIIISVTVLDHIILTSESYFSFADEGLLKSPQDFSID